MNKLNAKTTKTEKIIHLLTTTMCLRNCKHCCNKQYDLNDIEQVTDDELRNAHTICLTGGEPFLFTNPCEMGLQLKRKYKNIKKVFVYTNAFELAQWLYKNDLYGIDGLNISIKTNADVIAFDKILKNHKGVLNLSSNLLYIFERLYDVETLDGFTVFHREWQEDFEPADDSIFRRI